MRIQRPARRALPIAVRAALLAASCGGLALSADALAQSTETITVSGSRLPAAIRSMPQSVQIIEAEDIDHQEMVASSMADILANLIPGISRGSNTSVNTYTSIRGRKPVFLIDGVLVTSTLNDTGREMNLIDPDSIRRIEVVPGASALYGNSAGAGFINYVTKAGEKTGGIGGRTEVGAEVSLTEFSSDGTSPYLRQTFTGVNGPWDYRISGMVKRINDYFDADGNVIPPQLGSAIQDSDVKSAQGKVGYNFGRQRIEGSFSYYDQEAEIKWAVKNGNIATGLPATAIPAVAQPGQVPEEHEALVTNLVYSDPNILDSSTSFRTQLYYVDTKSWFQYAVNRFPLQPSAPNGQSGNRTKKEGFRIDLNTPMKSLFSGVDGSILWGLDYMKDDTRIPLVDGRDFGIPQVMKSWAGFVQLQVNPVPALKLSAGIRYERSDLEVSNFHSLFTNANITGGTLEFSTTPKNIGAVYSFTPWLDAYAGFSQGFDIQQTSQNFRAWPVDINLAQTKPPANVIDSYEGGLRFNWGTFRASVGYWQMESSNGVSYVFNSASPNEPRASVAPDQTKGWEATFDYTGIEHWNFGGSYARSKGYSDNDNNGSYETPLQNRRVPPPSAAIHAETEFRPGSFLRVQGLWSGERNAFPNTTPGRFHEGKVNSWFTVDAAARFVLAKNMDLAVGIRNLFNKDYYTNYSEGFNTNDNYIKAPGRTMNVKFAISY